MTEAPPDPGASAAVLLGVGSYRHIPGLPTVANNLTRFKEVLSDKRILGLPEERCFTQADPATSAELIDPVIEAAKLARDTLIIYYAGHGFIDRHGALHLTLVGSRYGARHTAVPYEWLRDALLEFSRARRRVVILDCCYSGRAIDDMAGKETPLSAAAGVRGTYVVTSSAENVKALAPRKEECTAFTGELVRVLRDGVPGTNGQEKDRYLTLDMIYDQVRDSLRDKQRPVPQVQDRGRIGPLPFVHNVAVQAPPDPPPRRRRGCVAAVALGVALAAVAGTSPLWWPGDGGAASDACSPRAALLGFSDRLDKSTFEGEGVYGLSSLALTGTSTALSLADNSPPVLYSLSLGEPGHSPKPRITAMTQLLRDNSDAYGAEGFDGEAIALEKGGRTALVASEAAPSVTRFDLKTGRPLDELKVPDMFRPPPHGTAQTNAIFESLALSPDGRHLYVGLEDPLSRDGSYQGRARIRILRYSGTPGGRYVPDRQIAYETGSGRQLAELTPIGDGERFLALERGYTEGQGNTVRIYEVSLNGLPDVASATSLAGLPSSAFVRKRELVDLGDCPPSGARANQPQVNPLLENVEGMALGPPLTDGRHKGRRPLYLVTDDNNDADQITRFYTLAVDVP
ncbi:esterase-like activity of phytase family protein [Streptomyces sp. S.PNR 29]|uniref:caspase, EACC1-associated type n=1 Tax=Streptomyces sp. S.PNR 29 TaxID=2973805 RepID=UPI0025AF0168|nr:esterase-like activity of phytase family protein [Streptomyces sp. S.PNR 29]MDN0194437.1 esterase-like activity of phytase family protein [Streptomyces sp. S.PNR 29]